MAQNVAITFFENEEPKLMTMLPRGSTYAELRQKWFEASGQSGMDVMFTVGSANGAELPLEGAIDDLLVSRVAFLLVFVHRAEEKVVRILGATDWEPFQIQLQPMETIEALTERIKEIVGIEEGRVARLLRDGRPLEEKDRASVVLAGCVTLDLDLQCLFSILHVETATSHTVEDGLEGLLLNEDLSKDLRSTGAEPEASPAFARQIKRWQARCFASEPGRTLSEGRRGEWRATAASSGTTIAGDESLSALLTDDDLLHEDPVEIYLERQMAVEVDDKLRHQRRTQLVWPLMRVSDLAASSEESVLLEGQLTDPRQSLWQAGVQSGSGVTITRTAQLSVFNEAGAFRLVTADLVEPLSDLRQRLDGFSEEFAEIWSDGEVLLDNARSLLALGIDSTCILYALGKRRPVVLRVAGAEAVRMDAVRERTSFSAFLQAASAALETELPPETRFVCTCGRIFSNESAERREFPMSCCRSPEARFAVEKLRRTRSEQSHERRGEFQPCSVPLTLAVPDACL